MEAPSSEGPLRLLYLNRLERRKGIIELISAVRSLPDADLALTIVGGDTMSGPDGTSMRAHAEALAAGDQRIQFVDRIPHEEVPRVIAEHHAVVVPTRWETFSYVVREALACNRPVIATPAGGIVDVIRHGESGWLTDSASAESLAATLREVLDGRDRLMEMLAEGLPRAALREGRAGGAPASGLPGGARAPRRCDRERGRRTGDSGRDRAHSVRSRRRRPIPDSDGA